MRKLNRRSHIVTIISVLLVIIGLVVTLFFKDANELITLITTLTAIVGAFAVYIQIRKSKIVDQSSFTIEISKYFYEIPEISDLVHKLGKSSDVDGVEYQIKQSERQLVIKYLNYIKTLATLLESKVITVETLNNVFAYEFFMILNNKSLQELEIRQFAAFYYDIFEMYEKWSTYKQKLGEEIPCEDTALSNLPEYKEYFGKGGSK